MISLLLPFLATSASAAPAPTPFTILASTYNASIVTLSFTPPSTLSVVSAANTTAAPWNNTAPTWLEPSATHAGIVFAVDEGAVGQVVAFDAKSIEPLSWASTQSSDKIGPLHAGTSADGKWLFTPNYGAGSHLAHPLDPATGLFATPNQPLIEFSGSSPTQEGPHPHMSVEHPTNGHVYVADLGTDEVHELALGASGSWELVRNITISPPGSGPRHLRFSQDGSVAYLLCETTSALHVFAVSEDGWTEVSSTSILPKGATPVEGASMAGAELLLTKDGSALYASNRNDAHPKGDAIAAFALGEDGTTLSKPKFVRSGGVAVRGMMLSPDERYLVAGTQLSGTVAVFERRKKDGKLVRKAFLQTEERYAFNSFVWV